MYLLGWRNISHQNAEDLAQTYFLLIISPLSFAIWHISNYQGPHCNTYLEFDPFHQLQDITLPSPHDLLTGLLPQLPSWSSPSCTSVCPQHGRQREPLKICLVISLLHKTLPWLSVSHRVKVKVLTVSFKTPSGPTTYRPTSFTLLLSHCHSSTPAFSLLLQSNSHSLCQDLWDGPSFCLEGSFLRCLHSLPLCQLALIATMLITETSPYLLREVYPITPVSHSQ